VLDAVVSATESGSLHRHGLGQFFNLFDRENVTLVDGEINSPTFGKPLDAAGPGRIVELGVRFGF